jgi:hypothetical protein
MITFREYIPGACVTVGGTTTCESGYYQPVGGYSGGGASGIPGGAGGGCALQGADCGNPFGTVPPPKRVL